MAMILPIPDHQGQHEPLEPLQGRRPSGARDVLAARGHGERAEAADDGLRGERRRGAGLATVAVPIGRVVRSQGWETAKN